MLPSRFKLNTAVMSHLLKTFTVFSFVVGLSGCNENLKDCDGFWDKTFGRDSCTVTPSIPAPKPAPVCSATEFLDAPNNVCKTKDAQNITGLNLPSLSVGSKATLAATTNSGLAVSYVSQSTSVCTIAGVEVTAIAAGTCSIAANQSGDATHLAATQVLVNQLVTPVCSATEFLDSTNNVCKAKATQTITGLTLPALSVGDKATLAASSNSGLAVSYASQTAAVCTVNAKEVTAIAKGTCTISASQAGDATHLAATKVLVNQLVTPVCGATEFLDVASNACKAKATQTITGLTLPALSVGDKATLAASSNSGLAVSYASQTAAICTVNAKEVTAIAKGTCTLSANQAGDATHLAATPVLVNQLVTPVCSATEFLDVTSNACKAKSSQSITGLTLPALSVGDKATLAASSNSGLAVSYASQTAAICTVNAKEVTAIAAGTCSVAANQSGDTTHLAAEQVLASQLVTPVCKASEIYEASTNTCSLAISGVVADGYIKGATVFWDCNADTVADVNETSTSTVQGGAFKIKANNDAACQLTVTVPIGAIDEDFPNRRIVQSYTLLAVRGHEDFISPISTMVFAQMKTNASSVETASQMVANTLNIDSNTVLSDYLTNANSRSHGVAEVVAQVLQNNHISGQAQANITKAYSQVMSLASSISTANLSTQTAVDDFLNPVGVFLSAFSSTDFEKSPSDLIQVRPNSKLNLTLEQLAVLNEVIQDEDVKKVTRYGVIHWHELGYDKINLVYEKIKGKQLLADDNNALVMKIRQNRTNVQTRMSDYFSTQMQHKNKFFPDDMSTNFKFAADTVSSLVDGVTGVIAATSGKDLDLRKFRGSPVVKSVLKDGRVIDKALSKELLKVVATGVAGVANSADLISQAADAPDGQSLTKDQADAVLDVMDSTVTYMKDILKNKDFEKMGKAFSPALKAYGVADKCEFANGQSNVRNPKCIAALLELTETLLEQFASVPGVGNLQGAFQAIRAGFDAYNQGVEYAAVTDKEVSFAQDVVSDDWDNKIKKMLLIAKAMEFQAGGYDQYFEAYVPVPCDTGYVAVYGVCISPTVSITPSTLTPTINQPMTFTLSGAIDNFIGYIKEVIWTFGTDVVHSILNFTSAVQNIFTSVGEQTVTAVIYDTNDQTIGNVIPITVSVGCPIGKIVQDGVCISDITTNPGSSGDPVISPLTATAGQKQIFTVTWGNDLPAGMYFHINDCENTVAVAGGDSHTRQFECTFTSAVGVKNAIIKSASNVTYGFDFTVSVNSIAPPSGLLNDTGITQCSNDNTIFADCSAANLGGWFGLNQDGEVGRDFLAAKGQLTKVGAGDAGFDFTKISATGQTLPANAAEWSCVQDNQTGLMWEVKTDDGGLRDKDNTYQWYNSDFSSNGGTVGYENSGNNTQAFAQAVNSQSLCGRNNWRLPSKQELHSIVNYGKYSPAIDRVYFPNTVSSDYWSSSPVADYSNAARIVYFGYGYDGYDGVKSNALYVRLVRSNQ